MNSDIVQRAIQDSKPFHETDECDQNCRRNANFNEWLHEIYEDKLRTGTRRRLDEGNVNDDIGEQGNVRPSFDSESRSKKSPRSRSSDHLCRNSRCCNSRHAPSGTQRDTDRRSNARNDFGPDSNRRATFNGPASAKYNRLAINTLSGFDANDERSVGEMSAGSASIQRIGNRVPIKSQEFSNLTTARRLGTDGIARMPYDGPSMHSLQLLTLSHHDMKMCIYSTTNSENLITQANTLFNSKLTTDVGIAATVGATDSSTSGDRTARKSYGSDKLDDGMSYHLLGRFASDSSPRRRRSGGILESDDGPASTAPTKSSAGKTKSVVWRSDVAVSPYADHDVTDYDVADYDVADYDVADPEDVADLEDAADWISAYDADCWRSAERDSRPDLALVDRLKDIRDFEAPVHEVVLDVFTSAHGLKVMAFIGGAPSSLYIAFRHKFNA